MNRAQRRTATKHKKANRKKYFEKHFPCPECGMSMRQEPNKGYMPMAEEKVFFTVMMVCPNGHHTGMYRGPHGHPTDKQPDKVYR